MIIGKYLNKEKREGKKLKNIKKLVGVAIVAMTTFSLAGCNMIEKTPEAIKNTVVAKIDKQNITLGQVDEKLGPAMEQIKKKYGEDYKKNSEAVEQLFNVRKQTLENMVMEKVFVEEANKLKLTPPEEELNKEIDTTIEGYKKQFGDKYEEVLKAQGLNNDTIKDFVKDQILIRKASEYATKDVKVTDADAEKYYNEHKDQFTKKPGAELSHILVKNEDESKKIKQELDNGASFADEAKKYGTDGTKDNGGKLGFVEYDTTQMDKDFMAAAKQLKDGEISGPVKTQFGYHIIKAEKVQKDSKIQSFADVKEQIIQTLTQQEKQKAFMNTYDKWKKELGVKLYEDKLKEVY